jgi:hypothetical protein
MAVKQGAYDLLCFVQRVISATARERLNHMAPETSQTLITV